MSQSSNNNMAQNGTIDSSPPAFVALANLLPIFSEWASLLPITVYLASPDVAHALVGRIAISVDHSLRLKGGSLAVSIFPRLGVFAALARLLEEGSEYLDRSCSINELRREVWDVNWGSHFPCANGAACDIITRAVLRRKAHSPHQMPDTYIEQPTSNTNEHGQAQQSPGSQPAQKLPQVHVASSTSQTPAKFRRYQTLHVIHVTRADKPNSSGSFWHDLVRSISVYVRIPSLFILVILGAWFYSVGLFGTASALILSATFGFARQLVVIKRPESYLEDNEQQKIPGCQLLASHTNATTWYLYYGDRGIIDSVLNKNMIYSISCRYGGRTGNLILASLFRGFAMLQLLTVTFVAAQKGWDGVALLLFVLFNQGLDRLVYSRRWMAKDWMATHGVTFRTKSFVFTGRTAMMGAIQLFKDSPIDVWMDNIISPSPRRQVWLQHLWCIKTDDSKEPGTSNLSESERKWVDLNLYLATEGAQELKRAFTRV